MNDVDEALASLLDHAGLVLAGRDLSEDVHSAITSATVTRTINGAPTLAISLVDPHRTLVRSGIFSHRVTTHLHPFTYEIVQVQKSGSALTVTCEDQVVAELRKHNNKLAVGAQLLTHVQFARRMVREARWIKFKAPYTKAPLSKAPLTRGDIARHGKKENTWDALNRLAQERGWRVFVRGVDEVWYVPDTWLINNLDPFKLSENTDGVDSIDFDFDEGKKIATATVLCRSALWKVPPGQPAVISKLGPANGSWLIQDINKLATSLTSTITLVRPQPILPEPKNSSATPTAAATVGTGSGGVAPAATHTLGNLDFVNEALSQVGKAYVYGAQTSPTNNDPKSFDCSLLVEWAAGRVGLNLPRTSGAQYQLCKTHGTTISIERAKHTRGALLFVGVAGSQHVAISMGNGKDTIEARGKAYGVNEQRIDSITWSGAGLIPGMKY
jgi:cell wall-associated NlpC family hydrolase